MISCCMIITSKMEVLVIEEYDSDTLCEISIAIKCNRCGRVLRFKKCTEKYLKKCSLHGQIYI